MFRDFGRMVVEIVKQDDVLNHVSHYYVQDVQVTFNIDAVISSKSKNNGYTQVSFDGSRKLTIYTFSNVSLSLQYFALIKKKTYMLSKSN